MSGDAPAGGRLPQWISSAATILAPASVLGGLLFYFGYVSSRSQYEYFGVDVDTIGLSTRDYVMRSPQPLLVPLLVLTLLGAGVMAVHVAVRRRIMAALPTRAGTLRHTACAVTIAGLVALAVGVVLLFIHTATRALLIVGHDRMFLVPEAWSASNSTLVVPLDGSVRLQFQFQNQSP
jgi:hypothetical protein